jgi:hypothetical protein
MICGITKDEVIFASKDMASVDALRKILQDANIGWNTGFSSDGVAICCNRKQLQNIRKHIQRWDQAIDVIANALETR